MTPVKDLLAAQRSNLSGPLCVRNHREDGIISPYFRATSHTHCVLGKNLIACACARQYHFSVKGRADSSRGFTKWTTCSLRQIHLGSTAIPRKFS